MKLNPFWKATMLENDTQITAIFDLLEKPSRTDLPGERGDGQRGQMEEDEEGTFFRFRGGYNCWSTRTVVPDLVSISKLPKADFRHLLDLVFSLDNKDDVIATLNPKFINENGFEFACGGNSHFDLDGNVKKLPELTDFFERSRQKNRAPPYDFSKEYLLFFLIIFVKHCEPLLKLYRSEIRPDEFGLPDTTSWQRKLNKFLEREVFKDIYFRTPNLGGATDNWCWKFLLKCLRQGKNAKETGRWGDNVRDSYNFVKNVCDFFLQTSSIAIDYGVGFGAESLNNPPSSSKAKGIAFENHCIAILESRGWFCGSTPKSGDQGADIVASRGPIRFVIQCKDHKGSVGNDSVQQINAAKTYYQAQVAAVVTNSKYTKSAQHLAESTGVLLLFESDLQTI